MDPMPGMDSLPSAPIFGMAGMDNGHGGSNNWALDDIFADVFLESEPDMLSLGAGAMTFPGSSAQHMMRQNPMQPYGMAPSAMVPQVPGVVMPANGLVNSQPMAPGNRMAIKREEESEQHRQKRARTTGRNMSEQQKLERRERNREHAKRSRVRKKFLLESLQKSVNALQDENEKLRTAIRDNLPDEAKDLLAKTEQHPLIAQNPADATKVLDDPDYGLVKALQTAQQNFVITDPTLPDNPIVFASQGFLDLTGYDLGQVLGRNCRFLQGPDTDPKQVEKIRKAIEQGVDASVCLLNYRVDGATFWNQFFIAALRDGEGKVINYVGVQCKVSDECVQAALKQEEHPNDDYDDMDDDEEDDEDDA